MATSEAQARARKNWEQRHQEQNKRLQLKSRTKQFVKNYATLTEMAMLIELFAEANNLDLQNLHNEIKKSEVQILEKTKEDLQALGFSLEFLDENKAFFMSEVYSVVLDRVSEELTISRRDTLEPVAQWSREVLENKAKDGEDVEQAEAISAEALALFASYFVIG